MDFTKFVCCFIFIAIFQVPIQAQEWVSFQSEQKINDLVDTGTELLMATDAGLVVMNKSTLEKTIFNKSNSNLTNNHIQTITLTASGDTWIGTYDMRLAQFDGTDFQNTIVPEGNFNPLTIKLYDFKVAPNGDLWAGSSEGVFHKQGEYWSQYDQAELGNSFTDAWDIEINDNGEVFIASNHIHKYTNGVWSNISDNTEMLGYIDAAIFFDDLGDLYFAGDLDKVGRYNGTGWETFDIENFDMGLSGSGILEFTEDVSGNTYMNTRENGIFKLENNIWTPYANAQTTAFGNKTSYFYIDDEGNQWLNSSIYLSVNNNGNIQSTTISNYTIEYNNVNAVQKDGNGNMYFLTFSNENISVLSPDGNWSFFPYPEGMMAFEYLNDILFLENDDIWLASNHGYYHYNGIEWVFNELENCHRFAVDSQGKIYLRATLSIHIIDSGVTIEYNLNNSPINGDWIAGHGIDGNDNLWIAGGGENVIYKVSSNGTWTTYTDAEYPAINKPYGDFHFDNNGNVWVPSDIIGAIKFDGTTFMNPYEENIAEIEELDVHSIQSDINGKLYFSYSSGVTTLFNNEWENFNIEDVLQGTSSKSDIKFDDNGTLWWVNNRFGVFALTPENSTAISSDFEIIFDFSIYPNPAQNYTILDFTIDESADVNVFIYNYLGQLQSGLDLGRLPMGDFQHRVDLSGFAKGFYVVELQIGERIVVETIIVK